jgi:hypothetical protein
MTDNPQSGGEPERKRSMLLSPVGIGTMALLGTGAFAATNGFGLAGRSSSCVTQQIATSVAQCQTLGAGAGCVAAFTGGAQAVGLSRTGSGSWSPQPLRVLPGGTYQTMAGSAFSLNSCSSSSSSRSSSSSGFYYGGGSSGQSSGAAAGQSSVARGGFGSTSRGFFGGGG